jgi:hypothetical protein
MYVCVCVYIYGCAYVHTCMYACQVAVVAENSACYEAVKRNFQVSLHYTVDLCR